METGEITIITDLKEKQDIGILKDKHQTRLQVWAIWWF